MWGILVDGLRSRFHALVLLGALVLTAMIVVGWRIDAAPYGSAHRFSVALAAAPYADPAGIDLGPERTPRPSPGSSPSPTPPPPSPASAPVAQRSTAPAAPRAAPAIVVESAQQALVNQDRASAGLPPLTWSSCLAAIAASNAARMAAQGYISHAGGAQQDLGCGLGYYAGENVGYWSAGINDTQLNSMFMASPDHRANIMGTSYHYVATAWAVGSNGAAYIAVEFS